MSIDPGSSPPSQAVVQITMGRIYDVATETRADVRDLKTLVGGLIEHVGDHETRMRATEQGKADKADVTALEVRIAAVEQNKADKTDLTALEVRTAAVEPKVWMGVGIGLVAAVGCSGLGVYLLTLR